MFAERGGVGLKVTATTILEVTGFPLSLAGSNFHVLTERAASSVSDGISRRTCTLLTSPSFETVTSKTTVPLAMLRTGI